MNNTFLSSLSPANKLKVRFKTQNIATYRSMIALLNSLSPDVQECVLTEFCVNTSVNQNFVKKYLRNVEKMNRLAKRIRSQMRKYLQPGGQCAGTGCEKRASKMKSYVIWLDRQMRRIKTTQLLLLKKVPLVTTKCGAPKD